MLTGNHARCTLTDVADCTLVDEQLVVCICSSCVHERRLDHCRTERFQTSLSYLVHPLVIVEVETYIRIQHQQICLFVLSLDDGIKVRCSFELTMLSYR